MVREPSPEVPVEGRRADPRRMLAEHPLAAAMLGPAVGAEHGEPAGARADAMAHAQARDPRARLSHAAQELHGGRADFVPGQGLATEPADAPAERTRRTPRW